MGVGSGVRLKTDVNSDGRTDDKMDTGNSGVGENMIGNCLLLYVRGAGSESPRAPTVVRCRRRGHLHPQIAVCQLWRTHARLTELSRGLPISDSAGQDLGSQTPSPRCGHRPSGVTARRDGQAGRRSRSVRHDFAARW